MRFLKANAFGLIAIFIALSGSAYAVTRVPPNSVGTKQLRNGSVTRRKTAQHSLTGNNIRSATLGTVPTAERATDAGHATNADHATSADHATDADHAKGAATSMLARITGAPAPAKRRSARCRDLLRRTSPRMWNRSPPRTYHREHAVGATFDG